jgi:Glycosyl hydrolases family 16
MRIVDFATLQEALIYWTNRNGDAQFSIRVEQAVDLAHAAIIKRLRVREMQDIIALPLATGARSIPLPHDFRGFNHSPYILEVPGWTLESVGYAQLKQQAVSLYGKALELHLPRYYTIHGGELLLAPYPGHDATLVLPYTRRLTALRVEAPVNFVVETCPNLYFFGALAELYQFSSVPAKAEAMRAIFDLLMSDITAQDTFDRFNGSPLLQKTAIVPDDRLLAQLRGRIKALLAFQFGEDIEPDPDTGANPLFFDVFMPNMLPAFDVQVGTAAPVLDEIDVEFDVLMPATLPAFTIDTAGQQVVTLNFEAFAGELAASTWKTPGFNDPATAWQRQTGATPTGSTGPNGGADVSSRAVTPGNGYVFVESSGDNNPGPFTFESPVFDAGVGKLTLTFDLHMRFGSVGGIADGTLQPQGWNGSAYVDIGPAIVGSQQASADSPWRPSTEFGTYTSAGFSNPDFHFRLLADRGVLGASLNYDFAVDNLKIIGPDGSAGANLELLATEDFSAELAQWTWKTPGTISPLFAWLRATNATPTSTTGPNGGSNPATRQVTPGNAYAFTESSDPNTGPYSLEGPVLDASLGIARLTFDLFMKFGTGGATTNGTLQVQGWNGFNFVNIGNPIVGSQQSEADDPWKSSDLFGAFTSAGFSNADFRFRILGIEGGTNPSNYDFAVDNMRIFGQAGQLVAGGDGGEVVDEVALRFATGLRRLHVSKTNADPIDGTTADQKFTTAAAAFAAAQAGDVITFAAGTYRERPTFNKNGTVAAPIWIAAETPNTVEFADVWAEADAGQAGLWESVGNGVFRSTHGRPYMGQQGDDFLAHYNSRVDLEAGAVGGFNKPPYGFAFEPSENRVYIRLRNNANPNGKQVRLSETIGRTIMTVDNADNVIIEGIRFVGAGNARALQINANCSNVEVRNCGFLLSRFGLDPSSGTLIDWCFYRYVGIDKWQKELRQLNGAETDAAFKYVKQYFTGAVIGAGGAGNALYEGSIVAASKAVNNVKVRLCLIGPAFDGLRLGERMVSSSVERTVFQACLDDGIQFEDDTGGPASNLSAFLCRFVDCFTSTSHQQESINGQHFVYRNVFEEEDTDLMHPSYFLKTIRTPAACEIFVYHNLFRSKSATGNATIGTSRTITYPFDNGTANRVRRFFNNLAIFEARLTASATKMAGVENNLVVAPANNAAATDIMGLNGIYAGTLIDDAETFGAPNYTLQETSPARNAGRALPAGLPDVAGKTNLDIGPYEFGFEPGTDWPRKRSDQFTTDDPTIWTRPGGDPGDGGGVVVTPPPPTGGGGGAGELTFPKPLYGGKYAPWSIPASLLPTHQNSAQLLDQMFGACPGLLNSNINRFCPAIYDISLANTTAILGGSLQNSNIAGGTLIPWNTSLFITPEDDDPADADSYTLLVNFTTGECLEFFQSTYNGGTNVLSSSSACRILANVDISGGVGNVFTKENAWRISRACGIHHAAMMILRSEINAGLIPHALTWIYPNPTFKAFQPPAIKGVGNPGIGGEAGRGFMGLRIVFDGLTDADIETWLATLNPASVRPVYRTIARAARDYGFIASDHGGTRSLRRGACQFEHELSGKWSQFGITGGNTLGALHTLLGPNKAKARVIAQPVHAGNGSDNNVAVYQNTGKAIYPAGHPGFDGRVPVGTGGTGGTPTPPTTPTAPADSQFVPAGYEIAFRDEFTALSLDTTTTLGATPNGTWQTFFIGFNTHFLVDNDDECYKTHVDDAGSAGNGSLRALGLTDLHKINGNGNLELKVYNRPGAWTGTEGSKAHVGGMISGEKRFAQTFGYWECRARFRNLNPGLHWSIWLLANDQSYPPEIDMVEVIGNNSFAPNGPINAVFFNSHGETPDVPFTQLNIDPGVVTDFNTYGFLWTPAGMSWFFNGNLVRSHQSYTEDKALYFLITPETATVPGDFPGPVNANTFLPDVAEIDYVRIYKPTGDLPAASSANRRFYLWDS